MKTIHFIIVYYCINGKPDNYHAVGINSTDTKEAIKLFYKKYPTAQIIKVFEYNK